MRPRYFGAFRVELMNIVSFKSSKIFENKIHCFKELAELRLRAHFYPAAYISFWFNLFMKLHYRPLNCNKIGKFFFILLVRQLYPGDPWPIFINISYLDLNAQCRNWNSGKTVSTWNTELTDFHWIGRFSHRVAMSVCLFVCLSVCVHHHEAPTSGYRGDFWSKNSFLILACDDTIEKRVNLCSKIVKMRSFGPAYCR